MSKKIKLVRQTVRTCLRSPYFATVEMAVEAAESYCAGWALPEEIDHGVKLELRAVGRVA
jgi:hypothetical protein